MLQQLGLIQMMSLSSAFKTMRGKEQQITVPARKACMHSNLVLDAHCFSWPFTDPACIPQQQAQVDYAMVNYGGNMDLIFGTCPEVHFKTSLH